MIGKHYIIDPSLTNLLQGLLIFIIQLGNTATNLVTSTLQPNIYNRKHLLVSGQQQIQSSSNSNWNALPLHSSGAIWKGGKKTQKNKTTNAYISIVKKMLMLHKVLYHTFGICTINEA